MIKTVIKRNGEVVPYDPIRIVNAIANAMYEAIENGAVIKNPDSIPYKIAIIVENKIKDDSQKHVEDIQFEIEHALIEKGYKSIAKFFIEYRINRAETRKSRYARKYIYLSQTFLAKYKHKKPPFTNFGEFVYLRTYSRWIDQENRREDWWETVARAVDYNCSLAPYTSVSEAEMLFDNIFNLRQFLSGRTLFTGGTDVVKKYPTANFNCAFEIIDSIEKLKEMFYLLMVGAGVGLRILKSDVEQIHSFRTDLKIIHKEYSPIKKSERSEYTSLNFEDDICEIVIGDSKEGWTQALDFMLKLHAYNEYNKVNIIVVNYDNVRPFGERLETFGGYASGHNSMLRMLKKITGIFKKKDNERINLKPIDVLDIATIVAENVVVGGVRRSALMILVDADDEESINAKKNLYKQNGSDWIIDTTISHRQMSNNSIYYMKKPTRERLKWQLEQMRYNGEPGFFNALSASKRRPDFNGTNPCGEILLDSRGLCNLTTVNVFAFVNPKGQIDKVGLRHAQELSARAGFRQATVHLELHEWDLINKRDMLIGTSLTGWQDMVNATNMTEQQENELWKELREISNEVSRLYAEELGLNAPVLATTIKPEGTLSCLPTVSSGIHFSHSEYYVRRVRINSSDPLVKVCEELGYPVYPEVGQELETCTTKVIEFPIKAPKGKTKTDISAIKQLEIYKRTMKYYTDHNTSITVHVRNHEWGEVEEWLWNNWDNVIGVSFIPLSDSMYQLLPFEEIDQEEYESRISKMKPFKSSLLQKYESHEYETNDDLDVGDCASGICPIR